MRFFVKSLTPAMTSSISTPVRLFIDLLFFCNTFTTPPPTVPRPRIPTFIFVFYKFECDIIPTSENDSLEIMFKNVVVANELYKSVIFKKSLF